MTHGGQGCGNFDSGKFLAGLQIRDDEIGRAGCAIGSALPVIKVKMPLVDGDGWSSGDVELIGFPDHLDRAII